MSFSYAPSATPRDLDRVRLHTGQTVESESFLSDEEITMLLAEASSWQQAVITGIKFIISRLSQPNFTADWLKVDNAVARKGFEGLLTEKRREFGIAAISATGQSVYRADSLQTDVPDGW